MAVRYYDDAIIYKLQRWLPSNSTVRVLNPDETRYFYTLTADDRNDKAFTLPMISLYRNKDIELQSAIKQLKSFSGPAIKADVEKTAVLNVIPIKLAYQLDIYTKTAEEADDYVRNFLFKFINNPKIIIHIPYNNVEYAHTANIRILDTVSETSETSERLFTGQFYKWTIQLEIQDAFLFSIPYKRNWRFSEVDLDVHTNSVQDPPDESYIVWPEQTSNTV